MRELPTPTYDWSHFLSSPPLVRWPLRIGRQGGLDSRRPEPDAGSPPTPQCVSISRNEPEQRWTVHWARHLDEVRAAQALRHAVFVGEMGARLPSTVPGHDVDLFDDFCEHLLVKDGETGDVVGTYRVLTPSQAKRVGCFYADTEFDLTRLRSLRERMVELGRSCVHPDHRQGGVILALWGALADFMVRNQLDTMIGCASMPMQQHGASGWLEPGQAATGLWLRLRQTHLASVEYHVRPRLPLPVDRLEPAHDVELPPLIKGYLRLGAKVLGAPAWDPDFNTADLPLMMRLADMPPRYRQHFLTR